MIAETYIPRNKLDLNNLQNSVGEIIKTNLRMIEIKEVIHNRYFLTEVTTRSGDKYKECFFPEDLGVIS